MMTGAHVTVMEALHAAGKEAWQAPAVASAMAAAAGAAAAAAGVVFPAAGAVA